MPPTAAPTQEFLVPTRSSDRWAPQVALPVIIGLSVLSWVGLIAAGRAVLALFG